MYPFPQSASPAVRSHVNAQIDFFNALSRSLTRSFRDVCELNIQLGQTLLEESTLVARRLMTTDRPNDALSAAVERAQPTGDKLRAYQQHLSRLAASAQVDLSRVTEQNVQETSRTARALADEVARVATEETDRNMRRQQDALKNFQDPFKQDETRAGKADGQPIPANAQGAAPPRQTGDQASGKAG
jgi:phasin family protein